MEIMRKRTSKSEEDKTTYQTLHHISPRSYDYAELFWLQINLHLSIHEHGRYLKYESYFMQTCMVFLFCVWIAECFHIQLFMLVWSLAKSKIPYPIYKLNRSSPEISIMILNRRKKQQQQQQQNKTEIIAGLI